VGLAQMGMLRLDDLTAKQLCEIAVYWEAMNALSKTGEKEELD